jgi:hypothetical protein
MQHLSELSIPSIISRLPVFSLLRNADSDSNEEFSRSRYRLGFVRFRTINPLFGVCSESHRVTKRLFCEEAAKFLMATYRGKRNHFRVQLVRPCAVASSHFYSFTERNREL